MLFIILEAVIQLNKETKFHEFIKECSIYTTHTFLSFTHKCFKLVSFCCHVFVFAHSTRLETYKWFTILFIKKYFL